MGSLGCSIGASLGRSIGAGLGRSIGAGLATRVAQVLAATTLVCAAAGQSFANGLTWPAGRPFPTFTTATSLDVATVSGGDDQNYLFQSLEGVVNRTQSRVYLEPAAFDTFWLSQLNVTQNAVADPFSLITKYRSELHGIVIYDPAVIDTVNLATTLAGINDALVASPALAATLTAAPYSLPVIQDLRTLGLTNAADVYRYELANVVSQCSNRVIIGLNPTISNCLRDYAVATQAAVIWLDPTDATQLSLLDSFLANLASNAPYLGWWTNEPLGVGEASKYGVPTYAADFSQNLSALAGVPEPITPPAPPPTPQLENKVYVAMIVSDGDNVQECQNLVVQKWQDPTRGQVPISWTVQPGLVDLAPVVLHYFWSSASANDMLVSGPSGLGYTYPQLWPVDRFADYTRASADAMNRAGLRIITTWNDGKALSGSTAADLYAANMPNLLGITEQDDSATLTVLRNTLPSLSFAQAYGENETDLENGIDGQVSQWNGTAPVFVVVQGDNNQSVIKPSTFVSVAQHYASNPNVVFVRADHLFELIRESKGLAVNPQAPTPPASVLTLQAAPDLDHLIGRADQDGWSAATQIDAPGGTLCYGPYTTALAPGGYTARFSMLVDNNNANNDQVVTIDVFDSTAQVILASEALTREQFVAPFTYQEFDLNFEAEAGHRLEFRTFWTGTSYVRENQVEISQAPGLFLSAANDLAHTTGRADSGGWSASVGSDTVNGALAYGPYTTALGAGMFTATYSLMVDNNSANDDAVAVIDVNDYTQQRVIAQRTLTRHDFNAAGAYQTFTLWFLSEPGQALEFRTFWLGTSYVREDQVIVQPTNLGHVFFAASDLAHKIGRADADGWSATCGVDRANDHMCYGPYTTAIGAGAHEARFGLMVDNNSANDDAVVIIDVNDPTSGEVLASRTVTRHDFNAAGVYQDITLDFTCVAGDQLEFRTYWLGTSYVREDRVTVSP